ncbi:DUF202 domain-containing protein [Parapedobacter indicus]|uniref:Putative membrane protein n=1 Tax=Parapedobacter indicus TaxID=1477437 RepID=A0A1I3DIN3_9SPHI|nr:DUF202 domain-containing protein [Parapedobacter indicus]PPL04693.1 putative membrane protein [Parapedobacter indicus]SFH86526.1 putative membrane protein [Parapedobacter indicus]
MNKDLILRERLAIQRTIMANQSTFLSFLRTSMYFAVAGVSLDQLLKLPGGHIFEYIFLVISAAVLVVGVVNYFIQKRRITESTKHIGDYKFEYEQGGTYKN